MSRQNVLMKAKHLCCLVCFLIRLPKQENIVLILFLMLIMLQQTVLVFNNSVNARLIYFSSFIQVVHRDLSH